MSKETSISKNDMARLIANETGDTIAASSKFIDAFERVSKFAIRAGKKINLRGFIKIETSERAGRTGRNPITGEAVEIPAKRVVKAKMSPAFMTESEGGEI